MSDADVIQWLRAKADELGLDGVRVFDGFRSRSSTKTLVVPVHVTQGSTMERLDAMQALDEAWNYQEPEPEVRIWIEPASESGALYQPNPI